MRANSLPPSDTAPPPDLNDIGNLIMNEIKSIKDEVKSIKDEVKSIKAEVKSIKDEVKSIKDEVKDEIKSIKDEIKSLKDEVKSLKDESKGVAENVDRLDNKLGNHFEITARQELRRKLGENFSRAFMLEDIDGIVRLALPKEPTFNENKMFNVAATQRNRAESLAVALAEDGSLDRALKHRISLIYKKIGNSPQKPLPEWIQNIQQSFQDYEKIGLSDITKRRDFLLKTNGLAIALITSKCIASTNLFFKNDDLPIRSAIQIDVRGQCVIEANNAIRIELGEIKSSSYEPAMRKAYRQLSVALSTLAFSLHLILKKKGEDIQPQPFLSLNGIVFAPPNDIEPNPTWPLGIWPWPKDFKNGKFQLCHQNLA